MADQKKPAPTEMETRTESSAWMSAVWLFVLALAIRVLFLLLAGNNGTDAWARYLIARSWLQHPSQIPSEVWLPLHFWLLGAALWIWDSEWSARLLTVFLGAWTVLFFSAFVRRVFGARVAIFSALMFALFGFHIAYSVTTSSEVPTIFFIVVGLYAWVRFYYREGRAWLPLSGIAFSAASLCRVEPWFFIPVLAMSLLPFSQGSARAWLSAHAWQRVAKFALAASVGAAGWMMYSFLKWADPFTSAKRSAWLSIHLNIHQPLPNRLIAVPGALIVTLSPPIVVLALLGLIRILSDAQLPNMAAAVLVLVLGGVNYFNAATTNSTMARYTLMYSWLMIPYAFAALRDLSSRWRWLESDKAFTGILLFVLIWQAGIIAGAYHGPPKVADKLASVSPTLPLSVELRSLVRWLEAHRMPQDAVIFDDFNYEAADVIRYTRIPSSQYFQVPYLRDPAVVQTQLRDFFATQHPRFLVYSPNGQLRSIWPLNDRAEIDLEELSARLHRRLQQGDWQVYEIQYQTEEK